MDRHHYVADVRLTCTDAICSDVTKEALDWCQGHHILDWIKGGYTDLDNLCLLCAKHHTEVHQKGWEIVMLHGRPHCVPPKWIDPYQEPRLNTAHGPPPLVLA